MRRCKGVKNRLDLNKKPIFLAAEFATEEMCSFQDRSDATETPNMDRLLHIFIIRTVDLCISSPSSRPKSAHVSNTALIYGAMPLNILFNKVLLISHFLPPCLSILTGEKKNSLNSKSFLLLYSLFFFFFLLLCHCESY